MAKKTKTETKTALTILGLSEDEVWNVLYEAEEIDQKYIGFATETAAYESIDDSEGQYARLSKIQDRNLYAVWVSGEMQNGSWWDDPDRIRVFEDYDSAKECFDSIPYELHPPIYYIKKLKAEINDPGLWIDVKCDAWFVYYNVKYNNFLILEKVDELDADLVKREIARYKEWAKGLEEQGISPVECYKHRPWNSNIRYYRMGFLACGSRQFDAQILSGYRNVKNRRVLDFVKQSWVDTMAAEIKKDKVKYGVTEEDKKQVAERPFGYDKAVKLFEFLMSVKAMNICDGALTLTKQWLEKNVEEEKRKQALLFLMQHGGYCDCEVLMNVSEKEIWEESDEKQ